MTTSQRKKVWLILAVVVAALIILAPTFTPSMVTNNWPFERIKLGLDLRGGTYLVYEVQTEEAVKSQLGQMAGSIKSELRKEKAGVLRTRQVGADRIEVSLLGDRGLGILENLVLEDYAQQLVKLDEKQEGKRFKISYQIREAQSKQIQQDAVEQAIETIRNRVDQTGVAEPTIQRVGEKQIMVQLPDVRDISRVKKTIGSVAKLDFRRVSREDSTGVQTELLPARSGPSLPLEEDILMTGDAIQDARAEINPSTNEVEVNLRLNSLGSKTFDRITAENVGQRLAIVLDGVIQSAPVIRDRISGGLAQITGGFTPEEAHQLAIVLRSGALPAPLKRIEERTVGATLGTDSINKGVESMLIGSLLVIIFMMIYYKRAGFLVVGCLILNVVLLLGLLAMMKATLTLPGIAGLILTVGMAVDANVIIFERIREELRNGATARAGIDGGFLKAHWTILDANITTLLTGMILYSFGSGPIKGFAVTLCLGIVTSLFTALFVAKVGFEVLKMKNNKGELSI